MGIRLFLVLICCLAATIPATLFWVWPQTDLKNIEIELANDRHQRVAEDVAERLELYGRDVNSIVRLISRQPTESRTLESASLLLASKNISCVCVYDTNSLTLTRAVIAGPVPCQPELTPVAFDNLLSYVGEQFETEFVVAGIDPGFIDKIGHSVRFGEKGHVAIMDHAGNLLSHPKPQWNDGHKNMLETRAFRETIEGDTGIKHFMSPAMNEQMIAGTARVPQFGWGVLVPQPISEIHARFHQFDKNSVFVIGIGIFLALLAALAAARLISRPIEPETYDRGAAAERRRA